MSKKRFARGQAVEPHHIYVPRREDYHFYTLAMQSSWFAVQGCRTMGKTSLAVQHLPQLQRAGCRVALLDLGGWTATSAEQWFLQLGKELVVELGGEAETIPDPEEAVRDFASFLQKLTSGEQHTVIVFDEVDWLLTFEFRQSILARLRAAQSAWAVRGWPQRVTLCFIGLHSLTEIAGPSFAPVVETISIEDFTLSGPEGEKVTELLAVGFPSAVKDRTEIARLALEEAGGQPFQTMILAAEISNCGAVRLAEAREAIASYLHSQRQRPRELLEQISRMFKEEPIPAQEALNLYEQLLRGQVAPLGTDGADFLLRSGLTRARNDQIESKGPLFRKFFDEGWVKSTRDRVLDEYRRKKPVPTRWTGPQKPRVCILNTGGTVGMVRREGKVVAPRDEGEFLENFGELNEVADIEFEQPFVRDSINVYPEQWTQIAETIHRKRNDGYTGFVVAHGTDTMAFTASAVAFALGQSLTFPVVFTGAQTTPEVLHGDSHANLLRACAVASEGARLPEVVICFGTRILRAVRAQKRDERRFEGFESPSFPLLGEITENILLDPERIRFFRHDLIRPVEPSGSMPLQAHFARGLLMIQLTPGLEPDFYLQALGRRDETTGEPLCQGVILQTLGAGNVANLDPYSFTPFLRAAVQAEIPVLVTSPYPWSSDLAKEYAPAAEPAHMGAIVAGEMTAAAAATKFRWAIAAVSEQIQQGQLSSANRIPTIREIMGRNYLGEKDGPFWDPDEKDSSTAS